MKIVVIGSSNTDMVVKSARLPGPGETVMGHTFFMAAGGKGANQAVAAAKAGGSVTFIAKVGNDMFGKQARQGFELAGIDTRYVLTDPNVPSGVAQIMVDARGENSIVVVPGANMQLLPDDIAACWPVLEAADIILMQLEIPMETVEYVIRRIDPGKTRIILNPAPASNIDEELFSRLYCLTPNESEAELLTGLPVTDKDSCIKAARELISRGLEHVILTRGAKGALWIYNNEVQEIDAFSVTPIDTTAAGDVFNGALCVALGEGRPMKGAIRFANAAAAISVTRDGAQPSAPSRQEITYLLQS
jgi:ribokinase